LTKRPFSRYALPRVHIGFSNPFPESLDAKRWRRAMEAGSHGPGQTCAPTVRDGVSDLTKEIARHRGGTNGHEHQGAGARALRSFKQIRQVHSSKL
jgi:hypothetical protein